MKTMKAAVLGAGTIVPGFLEAAAEIPELEIAAIMGVEADREKMTALQEKHGIGRLSFDYEELLADEEIGIIYVALPNHLHYSFAKKAVEHGKHVIVEKPFASTYMQAKDLLDSAAAAGVMVFEAISNQYMPNYKKTAELLPTLGDIKIVQLNYSQYSRRYDQFKAGVVLPVFDPKKSGGALMDLNVYNIHYILGLFGRPDSIRYLPNMERGIDTSGILTLSYPTFQCVSVAAKDCKAPVSINIQGDQGYIHSDEPANCYGSFMTASNAGEPERISLNEDMPRLYYELRTFMDLVLAGDEAARETMHGYNLHTLAVQEILDEARRQAGIEF